MTTIRGGNNACKAAVLGLVLAACALAHSVALAPIGPFGEHLTGCYVEGFRFVASPGHEWIEYRDHFHGLSASGLPYGEYEASVQCREMKVYSAVKLHLPGQFEVISLGGRITRSDHKPSSLVIQMPAAPTGGDLWWVVLSRLYGNGLYVGQFEHLQSAQVGDPEPGSYLVTVLSSGGYECVKEIDLTEFTRVWTFNSSACSFTPDKFAHVVTDEDRRDGKRGAWYQEMRRSNEDLWRALEKAAGTSDGPR